MLYTTSLKFPFIFSATEGKTDIATNFESINQSIALILLTGKGEVFGNPDFGSDLKMYQFREVTPEVQSRLAEDIVSNILAFESRVSLSTNDVQITQVLDRVQITITYILKNSNVVGNTEVLIPMPTPTII